MKRIEHPADDEEQVCQRLSSASVRAKGAMNRRIPMSR